jgi:hypothetical protein
MKTLQTTANTRPRRRSPATWFALRTQTVGTLSALQQSVYPATCVDILLINEDSPVVVGPWTTPFVAQLAPGTRIVGARVRPGSASACACRALKSQTGSERTAIAPSLHGGGRIRSQNISISAAICGTHAGDDFVFCTQRTVSERASRGLRSPRHSMKGPQLLQIIQRHVSAPLLLCDFPR